jgi:hypothetical protein
MTANGSKAPVATGSPDVCFYPDSGGIADVPQPPLGADSVEKGRCRERVHFLKTSDGFDVAGTWGTASTFQDRFGDLPSFTTKAFPAGARSELISARFLLRRYFRLFQQNRPN